MHPVATCRMGTDTTVVTDPTIMAVLGIHALLVAGASVIADHH
ncbi:GMC oxidoreductase [Streptomyces sp. NPDC002853]